ncbi:hypothetical protein FUSNEC_GEN_294_06105 [Fusobacterium necrophorum subsp. funduliforme]|uniref:hypothetical protein n=1 Tax=Fusobacterium necrophorum TaxID=859 RepID=UPI00370DFA66
MIQEYKNLKKELDNSDSLYEKNSIANEPLFGLSEFYETEYISGRYNVKIKDILSCFQEMKNLVKKQKFLKSYLESYKEELKKQLFTLDKEYFNMSHNSIKGQFFLDMIEYPSFHNRIIEYDIIYRQNTSIMDKEIIKTDQNLETVDFYLKYHEDTSFFVNFSKLVNIQNIYFSFHNLCDIHLFGVKEDDTLEYIDEIDKTLETVIINRNSTLYKGLFIDSVSNINTLLKELKVFQYSKKSIRKNGYIVYALKNIQEVKEISCISYSDSELYLLTYQEYQNFLLHFQRNENEACDKFLDVIHFVDKNTSIKPDNKNIIVEKMNKNTIKTNLLKIFGVENEN